MQSGKKKAILEAAVGFAAWGKGKCPQRQDRSRGARVMDRSRGIFKLTCVDRTENGGIFRHTCGGMDR